MSEVVNNSTHKDTKKYPDNQIDPEIKSGQMSQQLQDQL